MMTNREKLAFRILASLYPDSRPSQIRKIIEKAQKEEVSEDDIQLWDAMTKEQEPETIRIVEHHDHYYPYHPVWYENHGIDYLRITCSNTDTYTAKDGTVSSVTTDANKVTL